MNIQLDQLLQLQGYQDILCSAFTDRLQNIVSYFGRHISKYGLGSQSCNLSAALAFNLGTTESCLYVGYGMYNQLSFAMLT